MSAYTHDGFLATDRVLQMVAASVLKTELPGPTHTQRENIAERLVDLVGQSRDGHQQKGGKP